MNPHNSSFVSFTFGVRGAIARDDVRVSNMKDVVKNDTESHLVDNLWR